MQNLAKMLSTEGDMLNVFAYVIIYYILLQPTPISLGSKLIRAELIMSSIELDKTRI